MLTIPNKPPTISDASTDAIRSLIDSNPVNKLPPLPSKQVQKHEPDNDSYSTSKSVFDGVLKPGIFEFQDDLMSDTCYQYIFSTFMKELIDSLEDWEEISGSRDSISRVRKIKQILENHKDMLSKKAASRLLYGTISLILSDNTWSKMSKAQIKGLKKALINLQNKNLSTNDIKRLHQRIYDIKISLIAQNDKKEA